MMVTHWTDDVLQRLNNQGWSEDNAYEALRMFIIETRYSVDCVELEHVTAAAALPMSEQIKKYGAIVTGMLGSLAVSGGWSNE